MMIAIETVQIDCLIYSSGQQDYYESILDPLK